MTYTAWQRVVVLESRVRNQHEKDTLHHWDAGVAVVRMQA